MLFVKNSQIMFVYFYIFFCLNSALDCCHRGEKRGPNPRRRKVKREQNFCCNDEDLDDVQDDVADDVPDDVADGVPDDVADDVPDDVADGVADGVVK